MAKNKKTRARRLGVERLEPREVMATFGVPWPDARRLTVSFVPDGTQVGTGTTDLFATMDSQMPREVWQNEILRAFQTWGSVADVEFSVVSDDGSPLGSPGLVQHDPRFGDVRIAGGPTSTGVLALGNPYSPVGGGTWAGDVVFGDSVDYTASPTDLYSIALHEAGHVLGLEGSSDPASAMYQQATASHVGLSATDVVGVTSLYGSRVLPNTVFHSTAKQAVAISPFVESVFEYAGDTPIVAYSQLLRAHDPAYFKFDRPLGYQGPISVRVQTGGVSLLRARVTVLDARGSVLGTASPGNGADATTTVTFTPPASSSSFYVRVEGATTGVMSVGRFAVGISFDAVSTMPTARLVEILKLPLEGLSKSDVQHLLRGADDPLFNDDDASHSTTSSAQTLAPIASDPFGRHFRVVGSVTSTASVDVYRINSPKIGNLTRGVLTLTARGFDIRSASASVALLDDKGNRVSGLVLANGNGVYTIQVADVLLGRTYFVKVSGAAGATGNYELSADFGTVVAETAQFAAGRLTADAPSASFKLIVAEAQVFQLLLSAESATAPKGTAVTFELRDEQGALIATFGSQVGQTTTGAATLLLSGTYTLTAKLVGDATSRNDDVTFSLFGATLDDPVGPTLINPTTYPVNVIRQTYTYWYFVNGRWVAVTQSYYVYAPSS